MIIVLRKDLFDTANAELHDKLAQLFNLIISDRCLVDISDLIEIFINEHGEYSFNDLEFSKTYLSPANRSKLEDFIKALIQKSSYLTELHKKYLSHYHVGLANGDTTVENCLRLLENPSKIILENASNDWKFIKGIAEKYANHKKRKDIYRLIFKNIENKWIEAEQAGGKGQIKSRFIDLSTNRYSKISKPKIMALFDSDRTNATEMNPDAKALIEFLKSKPINGLQEAVCEESDLIIWHILYKREVENYVPVELIVDNLEIGILGEQLGQMNSSQLDFLDYDKYLPAVEVKNVFPNLFLLNFTRDMFEERCSHHKENIELPSGTLEQVSEIEVILLKIAKII